MKIVLTVNKAYALLPPCTLIIIEVMSVRVFHRLGHCDYLCLNTV